MSRPGIRTSEFWIIAIMGVIDVIVTLTGAEIDGTALATANAPAIAYAVSRGLSKFGKAGQ